MGTLTFTATVSLDGYAADSRGDFQWSAPSDEVFAFHIERMDPVSTEILGRSTYLLMKYWEQEPEDGSWGDAESEFARRWNLIDHVVASSSLTAEEVSPSNDRLIADLRLEEIERIVADAPGEVEIFGPTTAAPAIRAGLVTDYQLFVVPKVVGGGLRAFPQDASLDLRLIEQRTFGEVVYLHYARA